MKKPSINFYDQDIFKNEKHINTFMIMIFSKMKKRFHKFFYQDIFMLLMTSTNKLSTI